MCQRRQALGAGRWRTRRNFAKGSAMAQPSFQELAAARYVSLMTFRRNGIGVPTPLWIAPHDGKLYAVTDGTSAKMKRLRATDRVRLAACDARQSQGRMGR